MKREFRHSRFAAGHSLGEMLVAMVIGAMVLTAVLGVYTRANRAAEAVLKKLESPSLATEVLQLIAEDFDRLLGAEDVRMVIKNGYDNGFPRSQLVLRRTYRDAKNEEQTFEQIVWQAAYDSESELPGLVIYRSYDGVGLEDKLLDSKRATIEKNYSFVPICRGVTVFRIEAYKGEELVDQWTDPKPSTGIKITLSFAEPYETVRGTWDVLEHEKVSRTVAVDRARKIKFALSAGEGTEAPEGQVEQTANDARQTETDTERAAAGAGRSVGATRSTGGTGRNESGNERTPRTRTR